MTRGPTGRRASGRALLAASLIAGALAAGPSGAQVPAAPEPKPGATEASLPTLSEGVALANFVRIVGAPNRLEAGTTTTVGASVELADGQRIRFPPVRWSSSDTSVLRVDPMGRLSAVGPGRVILAVRTPYGADSATIRVEGVVLLVNGRPRTRTGTLLATDRVVVENGRIRLRFGAATGPGQRAGVVAEVWAAGAWVPGTTPEFGDYTYVGSEVASEPTAVTVVHAAPHEVVVRMTFANHRFEPIGVGLASTQLAQPYPFDKTVWLRAGEDGYYAVVSLHETLPGNVNDAEHEIGFGGFWGPGTIRTSRIMVSVRDRATAGRRINVPARTDAAAYTRPGDPIVRVLVPLRPTPFMVPAFSEDRYGSLWLHSLSSESYGAYLYMAPDDRARPSREVCTDALLGTPTTLTMRPTAGERAICGRP